MTTPDVRVVCVTYHPGPELEEFAASLVDATERSIELVIIENGTDDAVAREVAERHGARLVVTGENLGYGRAANRGAEGALTPWLVVANPDVVWQPGALDVLISAAERHPRAGALGPRVLNADGSVYPSARSLPSLGQGIGHALLVRVRPDNRWTTAYLGGRYDEHEAERGAGWLSGACLLLRREAFEQVGGFDDAFFMFFEDVDLGDRLGRAGWSNVYVPAARVTHVQGTSWRARPEPMIRAHHRSASVYLSRRYARPYQWPLRAVLRAGLKARMAVELRAARRQG